MIQTWVGRVRSMNATVVLCFTLSSIGNSLTLSVEDRTNFDDHLDALVLDERPLVGRRVGLQRGRERVQAMSYIIRLDLIPIEISKYLGSIRGKHNA